jgi:hypothetical protein
MDIVSGMFPAITGEPLLKKSQHRDAENLSRDVEKNVGEA